MGSLVSQVIFDDTTLNSNAIKTVQFTEMKHRSSDAILVKLVADYLFMSGNDGTPQTCDFGIINKPISEGTPVQTDFSEEKYVVGKATHRCQSLRNDTVGQCHGDELHLDLSLHIVIPIDWQSWFVILNNVGAVNHIAYMARLFWSLI